MQAGFENAVPKQALMSSTHTMDFPSAPAPTIMCITSGCLCRETARAACASRMLKPLVLANAETSKAASRCRAWFGGVHARDAGTNM